MIEQPNQVNFANELASLNEEFAKLNKGKAKAGGESSGVDDEDDVADVNYVNQRGYQNQNNQYRGYPQGNPAYHSNNINHPNFSYANPNNAQQPPPGFGVQNGAAVEQEKVTWQNALNQLIKASNNRFDKLESKVSDIGNQMNKLGSDMNRMGSDIGEIGKHMKMLETQVGQLATRLNTQHKQG